jgi:ABC-type bacteriocin/lantibiotic exporter with double-glycine peptidase domain
VTVFDRHRSRGERARLSPAFLFLSLLVALAGCASTGPELTPEQPTHTKRIDNVPFFPQPDYQCGPAALASVLNFYGDPATVEEIADAVYRDGSVRGTLSLDLVLYARSRGLDAAWNSATLQELLHWLDHGMPLIVMLDQGFSVVSKHHFLVVVGFGPAGLLIHDGKKAYATLPWSKFIGPWERTGNWTLKVVR